MVQKVTPEDRRVTDKVIEAREKAGLNQAELADRLGLSRSGYNPYEKYESAFSVAMLFQLAPILGKPVEYFLGLDTDLSEDEAELLACYRRLPDDRRPLARAMLNVLYVDRRPTAWPTFCGHWRRSTGAATRNNSTCRVQARRRCRAFCYFRAPTPASPNKFSSAS